MTVVAIHQPNYAPWLGYFHKLARADVFVFLDDAQFSKQSYTNRVQILGQDGPRWLTQPVRVHLGEAINQVAIAKEDWARAHLDTLRGFYGNADAFRMVWPEIQEVYLAAVSQKISDANLRMIQMLAGHLGLAPRYARSAEIETGDGTGDDRLIALVTHVAPRGTYLSGKGGAKYQDAAKFSDAGIEVRYTDFDHPEYPQGRPTFTPGLSIFDAIFHLGWDGAAALVRP